MCGYSQSPPRGTGSPGREGGCELLKIIIQALHCIFVFSLCVFVYIIDIDPESTFSSKCLYRSEGV